VAFPSLHLSLLLVGVLLAGCAAEPASTPAAKEPSGGNPTQEDRRIPYTSAAAPAPNEATGSIVGSVLDEELLPIYDAEVVLQSNDVRTRTDGAGAFTLNSVAPGEYMVIAVAIGFDQAAKKVQVVAGEVAHANFTLHAIPFSVQGYPRCS
jgi:hypothetical protein